MDAQRTDFLVSMIDILDRLHDTCVNRGEPLLASVLAIAKGEAEDAHRHAEQLAALNAMREAMSSQTSWRPDDEQRAAFDGVWREGAPAAAHDTYADDGYAADAYADDPYDDADEQALAEALEADGIAA